MATALARFLLADNMFRDSSIVRPPVGGVESGFGALVVEMGILGLILWIFMSVAIVFSG